MYKSDIKYMPRRIKEAIVEEIFDGQCSISDLISLPKEKAKSICCFPQKYFPDFWIVTVDSHESFFMVVFEMTLTKKQEELFLSAMKEAQFNPTQLSANSLSGNYRVD